MALSKTAIANQALSRLGQPAIQDIDDSASVIAVKLENIFEQSVRALGRMHPWKCLKARAVLTQNATAPLFGYTYSYNLPENFIRMVSLNDTDSWDQEDWYTIEQGQLLTDEDAAKIVYVKYITDSTVYDALFIEALATYMAAKAATIIRQDEQLGLALMQEFKQKALPDAVVVDGNEEYRRPSKHSHNSEWLSSRRGLQSRAARW